MDHNICIGDRIELLGNTTDITLVDTGVVIETLSNIAVIYWSDMYHSAKYAHIRYVRNHSQREKAHK